MRDELVHFIDYKKDPLFIISNYHTSNQPGIHHVAIYKRKGVCYYMDSYGIVPFQEVIDFLNHFNPTDKYYSTFQIQKAGTKYCGQLCLYVLYKLYHNYNFFDIILSLKYELQ
jgi:hypothetical protein